VSQPVGYRTFASSGTPYTDAQQQLVDAIEDYLRTKGCELFTVGKHNHSARQPVEFARDLITTCDCAVVGAFERYKIVTGTEKPNSAEQKPIDGRSEPTVWNHLEAAMAYAHDLPMLVLVEKCVYRQGMLSKRFEWNAMEIDIDPQLVKGEQFRQMVDDWLGRVESTKAARDKAKHDLEKVTIREYLASMKPKEAWAIVVAVFTVLAAVAGAAYWAGHALHK
jgi:hypothetical protein